MSKHDDNRHDAAAKRIETEPLPGVKLGINLPEPEPALPLHRIPGRVTHADLAVIRRAVVLHLATLCDLDDDSAESTGRALASICRMYLLHERSTRHANQNPSGA
jgi:hypothetical protein